MVPDGDFKKIRELLEKIELNTRQTRDVTFATSQNIKQIRLTIETLKKEIYKREES